MDLRVAQILGCPVQSGAGRGALALHEGLLAANIDSHLVGRLEHDLPANLRGYPVNWLSRARVSILQRIYGWHLKKRYGRWPSDFMPVSVGLDMHTLAAYQNADIIHVQWVNARSAGPGFWRALSRERRPVVWTLRDMWPFTGGCHTSMDCERYQTGCGRCPLLEGPSEDTITAADAAFKARHLNSSMTFIAISRHTADLAKKSMVLRGHDIRTIPNSLLLQNFKVIDKTKARRELGLPEDMFIFATGATTLSHIRKGSVVLRELLKATAQDASCHWAIFGRDAEGVLSPIPENCTEFGMVGRDSILNQIYAAADVFVMPSLYETFGQVTGEAMASGTAVIAFDDTPAMELIDPDETGHLVPHGDTSAFVAQLNETRLLGRQKLYEMGLNARRKVLARFDLDAIIAQHIALYQELLQSVRQ